MGVGNPPPRQQQSQVLKLKVLIKDQRAKETQLVGVGNPPPLTRLNAHKEIFFEESAKSLQSQALLRVLQITLCTTQQCSASSALTPILNGG